MTSFASSTGQETDQSTYFSETPPRQQPAPVTRPASPVQCLCPFCGEFSSALSKPCIHCNREDTIETRAAATQRTGSWFIRDHDNTTSPGMSFDQLKQLVHDQRLTPGSAVRGPATGQLWKLAQTIRGLSREFGKCYSCSGSIDESESFCPHCERLQTVQDFSNAKPADPVAAVEPPQMDPIQEEPPVIPEVAGPARQALLGDPTIRIHHMGEHEDGYEDDEITIRPVIAETNERHVPKDDLLTPQDLAKAFQKEFGANLDDPMQPYSLAGQTRRQVKFVFAGSAAMAVMLLLAWEVMHVMFAANKAYVRPVASTTPPTVAKRHLPLPDAELASSVVFEQPKSIDPLPAPYTAPPVAAQPEPAKSVTPPLAIAPPTNTSPATIPPAIVPPTPKPAPVATAKPAPQPAHPVVQQIMMVEPTPTQSIEDDPGKLLAAGITAEANGNYAAAVASYERIQSLPSSQWPLHLQTRLELARQELKGDLK